MNWGVGWWQRQELRGGDKCVRPSWRWNVLGHQDATVRYITFSETIAGRRWVGGSGATSVTGWGPNRTAWARFLPSVIMTSPFEPEGLRVSPSGVFPISPACCASRPTRVRRPRLRCVESDQACRARQAGLGLWQAGLRGGCATAG